MKRIAWISLLFLTAGMAPAAEKTITVRDLETLLASMQQAHKTDQEAAAKLMELRLGEELSYAAVERMAAYLPGPLTTQQMYVLEGRSAFLPPAPSEIPETAAPDDAAQKNILGQSTEQAALAASQEHLTAKRTTARFQDGPPSTQIANSGTFNHAANTSVRMFEYSDPYMRYMGSKAGIVEIANTTVTPEPIRESDWGASGVISEGAALPPIATILQQASAAGTVRWERWQRVEGKRAAVFTFAVPKKKSNYKVEYCCFPSTQTSGALNNLMPDVNFQSATTWKPFRTNAGYRGELFVDLDTGAILRLIFRADLKVADFVTQESRRIDFASLQLNGKTYVAPVREYALTEAMPFGDSFARRVVTRHTLLVVSYTDHRPK